MAFYIETGGMGEYVEKKSRFIGCAYEVHSETEVQERLLKQRKRFYDARHHCYAYVLGEASEICRQSDDGEPSQTAGLPILNVLQTVELRDCLIVVTRYFGGTLLGTGGLVRAYTEGARAALAASRLKRAVDGSRVSMSVDYALLGKLQYLAQSMDIKAEQIEYGAAVELSYLVPQEQLDFFVKSLTELSGGQLALAINKCRWYTF